MLFSQFLKAFSKRNEFRIIEMSSDNGGNTDFQFLGSFFTPFLVVDELFNYIGIRFENSYVVLDADTVMFSRTSSIVLGPSALQIK